MTPSEAVERQQSRPPLPSGWGSTFTQPLVYPGGDPTRRTERERAADHESPVPIRGLHATVLRQALARYARVRAYLPYQNTLCVTLGLDQRNFARAIQCLVEMGQVVYWRAPGSTHEGREWSVRLLHSGAVLRTPRCPPGVLP
jgi:hypothetical protein